VSACSLSPDTKHEAGSIDYEDTFARYLDSATYYSTSSLSQSLRYADSALTLSKSISSKFYEGRAKYEIARAYLEHDVYDQALVYAFDALEIFKSVKNEDWEITTTGLLGWVYYDADQPKLALTFHHQLVAFYRTSKNNEELAMAINAVGLDLLALEDYVKAKTYFDESLKLGRTIKSATRISAALNNLGIVYNALGEYDRAIQFLKEAYIISKQLDNPLKEAENLNQLGHVYLNLGRSKEAEAALDSARNAVEKSADNARKEKLLDNYEFSARLYADLGNFNKAYDYVNRYAKVKDEILSLEKSNKLASSLLSYQSQKKEHEIRLLESESKLRALQRDALAGAILFFGVIAFLVYNRQVSNQKKERILNETKQALIQKELDRASLEKEALEKERLINEAKKELVQKELERASLEKEALRTKLEFKNELMSNFALQISQRNELVRSFVDELKSITAPSSGEIASKLNKIISHFTQLQNINKEAEEFNLSIESEHKDFLFNLAQRYPNLTENEKRLCIQVRLNLSIKDIASINNISVKSVEMARYRLRKRLNVDPEQNLSDFLKDI
jgi:tetratricopeptide (TPR) repeat protein